MAIRLLQADVQLIHVLSDVNVKLRVARPFMGATLRKTFPFHFLT
jgi:hypothetical protein